MVHTGVRGPAVLTLKNAALETESLLWVTQTFDYIFNQHSVFRPRAEQIWAQVFGFNGFILLLLLLILH